MSQPRQQAKIIVWRIVGDINAQPAGSVSDSAIIWSRLRLHANPFYYHHPQNQRTYHTRSALMLAYCRGLSDDIYRALLYKSL